ncbi:MAG TPA: hypothetical protein ENM97_06470 [Moorella mulderi]|nr:hypothetical protein [Moorella mulderi]
MKIIITAHTKKRLRDWRQQEITVEDVISAAKGIPGYVPVATRFRGFTASFRRTFDLVIKDTLAGRLVITVIGK